MNLSLIETTSPLWSANAPGAQDPLGNSQWAGGTGWQTGAPTQPVAPKDTDPPFEEKTVWQFIFGAAAILLFGVTLLVVVEFGRRTEDPSANEESNSKEKEVTTSSATENSADDSLANSQSSSETKTQGSASQVASWDRQTSRGGKFSFTFPTKASHSEGEVAIVGGSSRFDGAASRHEGVTYQVLSYHIDAPPSTLETEELLDKYVERFGRQKRLQNETHLSFNGLPVREFEYVGNDNVMVRTRVCQFPKRQIHVSIFYPAGAANEAAFRRFFESMMPE